MLLVPIYSGKLALEAARRPRGKTKRASEFLDARICQGNRLPEEPPPQGNVSPKRGHASDDRLSRVGCGTFYLP